MTKTTYVFRNGELVVKPPKQDPLEIQIISLGSSGGWLMNRYIDILNERIRRALMVTLRS